MVHVFSLAASGESSQERQNRPASPPSSLTHSAVTAGPAHREYALRGPSYRRKQGIGFVPGNGNRTSAGCRVTPSLAPPPRLHPGSGQLPRLEPAAAAADTRGSSLPCSIGRGFPAGTGQEQQLKRDCLASGGAQFLSHNLPVLEWTPNLLSAGLSREQSCDREGRLLPGELRPASESGHRGCGHEGQLASRGTAVRYWAGSARSWRQPASERAKSFWNQRGWTRPGDFAPKNNEITAGPARLREVKLTHAKVHFDLKVVLC